MKQYVFKYNGKIKRIKEIHVHTKKRFEGRYKGYYLTVWLDEDDYNEQDQRYYIIVNNPEVSFGTLYDGWADEDVDNLDDAIKEALKGATLI